MPLLLLCGQPCSGKSTVALSLANKLRHRDVEVVVLEEISSETDRNAAFKDSRNEKITRGKLKANAERSLRGGRVVILDALNSIKGYRYELWCLAKASKTRYCLVHCEMPIETSRNWNEQRKDIGYSSAIFEDLATRFESPDTKNRWDRPLFRIDPRSESLDSLLENALSAILGSHEHAAIDSAARTLEPTIATQNPELSRTNLLNDLDANTQSIVNGIISAQGAIGGEAAGDIYFDDGLALHLSSFVGLPELRRQKRAFMKLATQNNWTRLHNAQDAKQMFVEYLVNNLQT